MPNTSAEKDLQRASELRALARRTKNVAAKQEFDAAADRYESKAAQKAKKLARNRRRKQTSVQEFMR